MRTPWPLAAIAIATLSGAASAQTPIHHRLHTGITAHRGPLRDPNIRTVPYPWELSAHEAGYGVSYGYPYGYGANGYYSAGIDNPSNLNNDVRPGGLLSESAGPHGEGVSQF